MFDLEQKISDWRNQMLAAGIECPVPLEELEIHLREEIERRIKSGLNEQKAFAIAADQIGGATVLKKEFFKVRIPIHERLKQIIFTLARIPNYRLATNMNTSNPNIEPRWATYLKNAAYVLPAFLFWAGSMVFVVPNLIAACQASSTALPKPITFALALSEVFKNYTFLTTIAILTALILVEWRWHGWPRYRRMIFGILAFVLNFIALVFISTMLVLAVICAQNSLHPLNGGH